MAHLTKGPVAQQIGALFEGDSVVGLSDRELIERFNSRRDAGGEAAFAALVARHGPMVCGVCRQLLDDRHLAEDAFQATFLVLARRACSIREPDRLGNWLYGVAFRTARCARSRVAHRREKEQIGTAVRFGSNVPGEPTGPTAEEAIMAREQSEALHGEIARLPDAFRLPVVLCYLEGLTVHEAARQLRWSHGTVRSRMARAREKLRRGLTRRGIVLPAAALATVLDAQPVAASVSSPLYDVTTRAALRFAAEPTAVDALTASTTALAQEVLRSMLFHKLKLVAMTVVFLGAVATSAGYLASSRAMNDDPVKVRAEEQARPAAGTDRPPPVPAQGRMFVTGVVLDPAGKPAAGVPVDIIGQPRAPRVASREYVNQRVLLGRGDTDADGHFRLDAMRTSADGFFQVYALAAAPGFGLGWVTLNADAKQPAAEIRLRPEQVIRGKLFDVHGQPAAGVELEVWSVGRPDVPQAKGGYDGVNMGNTPPPEGLRVWPRPGVTDDQGRFMLAGIGRDVTVNFHVRDQRFASWFHVRTDDRDGPKTVSEALPPAMIVEGRVLAADTGQPIPEAIVEVGPGLIRMPDGSVRGGGAEARNRADNQGRYRANVQLFTNYRMRAYPPEGQPYLAAQVEFEWTKGAVRKEIDVKVPLGVVIRGKVVERGTDRALAEASVQYIQTGNRGNGAKAAGSDTTVASKKDGSYQITVRPGKGHLFVFGPSSDYVYQAIGAHTIFNGQPGGARHYAHDIIPYDVKVGDQPHEINAVLRPGKTIKGRVVGPENQTIDHAMIISLLNISHSHLKWRGDFTIDARDGLFELHGLDPEKSTRVYFLDAEHQWGETVEVSAKQAGENVLVRLQPCGQAKARVVGPDGKPMAKIFPWIEILGTAGPHEWDRRKQSQAMLTADAAYLPNVDRIHYWKAPLTDADGRVTLPALIPGALYRISDFSTIDDRDKGVQVRKDFSVKPGETIDLGDTLIENLK
jgi:RNA polymerase sigma factor (sigma-70 family)